LVKIRPSILKITCGATQAVVREIDNAIPEVLVQAYSFVSALIAKALVDTRRWDVSVEGILDKSQGTEKYSGATFLAKNRIPSISNPPTRSFQHKRSASEERREGRCKARSEVYAKRGAPRRP
jgi:hypothetical protein